MTILVGCSGPRAEAGPDKSPELQPVAADALCVTKGAIGKGVIDQPTVRAFATGSHGDAAQLTFTFGGDSDTTRSLASGQLRRQLGLKLRAANSCNVVYVMWRLDPRPMLEVSVKHNPGMATHAECGANGYTKVKPAHASGVPSLDPGSSHVLRAEIHGDDLYAWIDGKLAWRGRLPDEARDIAGPAGLRTDNVKLEGLELAAPHGDTQAGVCKRHEEAEE
jgi:hypothetical protein